MTIFHKTTKEGFPFTRLEVICRETLDIYNLLICETIQQVLVLPLVNGSVQTLQSSSWHCSLVKTCPSELVFHIILWWSLKVALFSNCWVWKQNQQLFALGHAIPHETIMNIIVFIFLDGINDIGPVYMKFLDCNVLSVYPYPTGYGHG